MAPNPEAKVRSKRTTSALPLPPGVGTHSLGLVDFRAQILGSDTSADKQMTTMLLLLLASVAALTQAAPVANQTTSPPAPPCTNNWPQGLHEIEYRGRKFLLAVPDGLPNGGGRRVPVVFDWHGYSESPWYQNLLVGLTDTLEEYTWIGVLPFGTAPLPTGTCCPLVGCDEECCHNGEMLDPLNACSFNAGSCCGAASNRDEDDITFARIILEWLQLEMCPDEDNLFATGFSNGGMITNRLGCQAADMFKAIAPVAGNMRFGNGFTEVRRSACCLA